MATIDSAAAAKVLAELVTDNARTGIRTMDEMGSRQEAAARRLTAIAERLAATLGKQHPRVTALSQSGEFSRSLAKDLKTTAKRMARVQLPKTGHLTFSGRVTDATGAAVPGLRVRLSDRTGTAKIPGSAVTDEFGDFSLAVPAPAADPAGELFVVAEDSRDQLVKISPEPVPRERGVIARVDLVIEGEPSPDSADPGSKTNRPPKRAGRKPLESE